MADEMMLENVPSESDEAEDWESDEAIAEAEDTADAEDIGEWRRRSRYPPGRYPPGRGPGRYPPVVRGIRGMTSRGPEGVRNFRFPAKVATAAETNRGLAKQEVGRRDLEQRLARLENRFRGQQNKDSSASGLVSLAIGVPLAAWGAINPTVTGGSRLENWASQRSTEMATLMSVSQIATSGAKLVINGRYHRSGIGIAADIFAAAQIATFSYASLSKPEDVKIVADRAAALAALPLAARGSLFLTQDQSQVFRVEIDAASQRALRLLT